MMWTGIGALSLPTIANLLISGTESPLQSWLLAKSFGNRATPAPVMAILLNLWNGSSRLLKGQSAGRAEQRQTWRRAGEFARAERDLGLSPSKLLACSCSVFEGIRGSWNCAAGSLHVLGSIEALYAYSHQQRIRRHWPSSDFRASREP